MTVLDVLDDLFPEGYYRDARERMSTDFLARLREMGGCAGAKADGLRDELGARYDACRPLPWPSTIHAPPGALPLFSLLPLPTRHAVPKPPAPQGRLRRHVSL
jgi:hypothetical protein